MKRIFAIIALALTAVLSSKADDRPVDFNRIPAQAQTFISDTYPGVLVEYALRDDDLIRPDYTVMLKGGVKIQFDNDGRLEKIESGDGIPAAVIPVQMRNYVEMHYPGAVIVEYEVGRRSYEVRLSNRMELKFNANFNLVEIDD